MTAHYRECRQCGELFVADQDWKRVCLDCWISNKNRRELKQIEQLQAEVAGLREENERYRRLHLDQQSRIASLELALTTERSRPPSPRYNGQAIPPDMLKRLIHLAHPDKHGGSEAATRATQWLLEQRG